MVHGRCSVHGSYRNLGSANSTGGAGPPACRGESLWGHTPQTVPGYRELSLQRLLCVLLLGWVHEQAKMGVGAEAPASELEAKQERATTVPSPSAFSPANLSPSLLLPGVALLGTDT